MSLNAAVQPQLIANFLDKALELAGVLMTLKHRRMASGCMQGTHTDTLSSWPKRC